jgi:uncharacterized protein
MEKDVMEKDVMEKDAVLLVFAKAPRPGAVKTRLAGDTSVLSEKESARLYAAFLKDALAQYVRLAETLSHALAIELHWSGPLAEADPFVSHAQNAAGSSGSRIDVMEQEGDGLGARMANAFQQALKSYQRAFILGTDHPTLPDPYIEEALHVLSGKPALCIGPSSDGGYYGLGMNRWTPQVFADMTYSHAHVFKNTLRRATRTDVEVTVLPEFYDVDTPTALRRMLRDLRDTRTPAKETRAVVEELKLYSRLGVDAG